MIRKANAVWHGTGKDGNGSLTTPSGVLNKQPYSWKLRFADESGVNGTNPEELIAAAHAGCFTMAVSFQFSNNGFTPEELRTEALLTMGPVEGKGNTITGILLKLEAKVPGVTDAQLQEFAANAKANCPVSRALSVPITLEATLV